MIPKLKDKIVSQNGSFGIGRLIAAKAIYNFGVDGGAVATIIPNQNVTIPNNAVIVGATVNSTTAVTSGGSATVAVGLSAGASATAILAATAKTSLTLDAILNGVPTFAAPVKTTAQGYITVTPAVAALTAGVIEVVLYYYVANN